jgi:prepilin-type processing-associated H-X9-DG protein
MRRSCFTLVELIVVVATVALLIAISLPSLRSSRQQAKAVACSSNVKQLTVALFAYETQNQTLPYGFDNTPMGPPPGGYPGYSEYDRKGWWWFNYITDYSRKDSGRALIIRCPSRQLKGQKSEDNILCGNYGVNRSICKSSDDIPSRREEFVGTPLCTGDIPHPSRTLLIVDSGYSLISWWHVADAPPVTLGNAIIEDTAYIPGLDINKKRDLWPGQEEDAIDGRHPNKTVNVGFADGHVCRERADDLLVEKDGNNYKNLRPLWQPK